MIYVICGIRDNWNLVKKYPLKIAASVIISIFLAVVVPALFGLL